MLVSLLGAEARLYSMVLIMQCYVSWEVHILPKDALVPIMGWGLSAGQGCTR